MIKGLIDKLRLLIKQPLIANMLIVGSLTLLVSFFGFYKELVVGSTFGLSEFLDTFALAILIPSFIENVFVGALSNIFIPNYIIERATTKKVGAFQTVTLLIITGIVCVFATLILILHSYLLEILFPGHDALYYDGIKEQLFIMLPCLFFWGYNSFLSALLEIKRKFLQVTITPICTSITTLIAVFFFKEYLGNIVLAVGILSGSMLSFTYLSFLVFYYKLLRIEKPMINNNLKLMIGQLPPKVMSGLLTGINPFVDQIFAAQLVAGSVIALSYGNKIPAFGITIAMVALGKVLLPHFSELVIKDLRQAYTELFKILKWIFFLAAILVCGLIFFSHDIISILFERDNFTSHDTSVVALIQQLLLLHVPFYLCTRILVKFLTSINKNTFMAWASLLNLIVNLIMNFVLIKIMGVYGLALSTTIVLIVSSSIYFFYTYKQFKLNQF